jgi:hypothetical protein
MCRIFSTVDLGDVSFAPVAQSKRGLTILPDLAVFSTGVEMYDLTKFRKKLFQMLEI